MKLSYEDAMLVMLADGLPDGHLSRVTNFNAVAIARRKLLDMAREKLARRHAILLDQTIVEMAPKEEQTK